MSRAASRSLSGGARFDRLDERLCGKRLGQVGDATRLDRGCAVRLAVVAGDIDDRQPYPLAYEAMAQFKAGFAIQVDVKDEAKGIVEIVMGRSTALDRPRTTLNGSREISAAV